MFGGEASILGPAPRGMVAGSTDSTRRKRTPPILQAKMATETPISPAPLTALPIRVEIFEDFESLGGFKGQWNALAQAVAASPSLSFEYAALGWREVGSARPDAALRVLVALAGEDLIAVWPLYVETGSWGRMAIHLGCGGHEEYAGPIVVRDSRRREASRLLFRAARDQADVLIVHNIAHDNPIREFLDRAPLLKHRGMIRSPAVSAGLTTDWATWMAARSKSFRSGLKYDRKRLSQLGEVRLEKIEAPDRVDRTVDWIFQIKRRSLAEHNITRSWVLHAEALRFFQEVCKASEGVNVYALMAGDEIAAAAVTLESSNTMEYYLTAYNHDLSLYSPGNLLLEDLIALCFARKLAFDFRITGEFYKLRWADSGIDYYGYHLATTPRGAPFLLKHLQRRAVLKTKLFIKRALKGLRGRLAAPKPSAPKAG
ncbi:GNAT family N-acetyltransferase [Phenylobacterium sp.]|uniref:GNAT family N-acetyltransferase n=1 Tax=Phenylobacterium sp. TaxID=1871053 RepID=UPI002F40BA5F